MKGSEDSNTGISNPELTMLSQTYIYMACQVVLVVKNLPADAGDLRETRVGSLGWEDSLEEGMATHSSILA